MDRVVWESVRLVFMSPNSYSTANTGLGIGHWNGKSTAACGSKQPVLAVETSWPSPLTRQSVTSIKKFSSWDGRSTSVLGFLRHISLQTTQERHPKTVCTGPPSTALKELLLTKLSLMELGVPRGISLGLLRSRLNSIPSLFWVLAMNTPAATGAKNSSYVFCQKLSLQLLQQLPLLSWLRPHLPVKARSQDLRI